MVCSYVFSISDQVCPGLETLIVFGNIKRVLVVGMELGMKPSVWGYLNDLGIS